MRRAVRFAWLTLLLAQPVRAEAPPSAAQAIVLASPDRASLRTRLAGLADSTRDGNPTVQLDAGEAASLLARLAARHGAWDEAIPWAREAAERYGNEADHLLLADALLARGRPEDIAEVEAHFARPGMRLDRESAQARYDARAAWARFMRGDTSGVARLLAHAEAIVDTGTWSARVGRLALATAQRDLAYEVLMPLAVAARGGDPAVLAMLADAAADRGGERRVRSVLAQHLAEADSAGARAVRAFGGRRVRFLAADGFPLAGVVVGASPARRPAAIVVVPAADSLGWYDSLSVHLVRAGFKVLLLDPRGVRDSADPSAPPPNAAFGYEDTLDSLTAADVRASLRALALTTPTDTTRSLVVGLGPTALIAADAARRDPRVQCVMLVTPWPEPCLRGLLRGALAGLGRPVFVQIGPEHLWTNPYAQRVADAVPQKLVRVADSGAPGKGAQLFRAGPEVAQRFIDWWRWIAPRQPTRRR